MGTVQASWLGPVPRDEKYRYGQASWLGRRPAGMRPASRTRLDGEGCGRRREAEMSWIRAELGRAVRFSGAEGPVWLSILGPFSVSRTVTAAARSAAPARPHRHSRRRVPHSHDRWPLGRRQSRSGSGAPLLARPAGLLMQTAGCSPTCFAACPTRRPADVGCLSRPAEVPTRPAAAVPLLPVCFLLALFSSLLH